MGDVVLVQLVMEKVFIKFIFVDEVLVDWVVVGQSVVLYFSYIDLMYVKFGDIICDFNKLIFKDKMFMLKVLVFDFLMLM